jgi:hypothetical protein
VDGGHSSKRGQEKLEWQLETLFIAAACGPKTAGKPGIMTRNIMKFRISGRGISGKGRIPASDRYYFEVFVMLRSVYGTERRSRNVGK